MTTTEPLLKPRDLQQRWGVALGHLANLRSARTGPAYIKLGSSVRYQLKDVIAYEEQNRVPTVDLN